MGPQRERDPDAYADLEPAISNPNRPAPRILCASISRHWEFLWLTFSGIVVCYTLRVNMSVAAQSMRDELVWTETQKGYVLSAFYWGYALGQIPASYLMMKGIFSPKWTFGFAVFIPSILTILVPLFARSSYTAALVIRMLIGFIESATFPSCYQFFVAWIPPSDKTFMIATMISGTYMGEIIGFSLSGALISTPIVLWDGTDVGGWPSVFYVFGLMGVLWFPVWAVYAYDSPEVHPGVTAEELAYIRSAAGTGTGGAASPGKEGSASTHLSPGGQGHTRNMQRSIDLNPASIGEDIDAAFARAFRRSTEGPPRVGQGQEQGGYAFDESIRGLHSVDLSSDASNHSSTSGNHTSAGKGLKAKLLSEQLSPLSYGGAWASGSSSSDANSMLPAPDEDSNLLARRGPGGVGRLLQVGSPLSGDYSRDSHHRNQAARGKSASGTSVVTDTTTTGTKAQPYVVDIHETVDFSRIPWGAILRHKGFWNLMYSGWCMGYIQFLLLSEVPSYLTDVLGFDLSTAGVLSTIPFGGMMLVSLCNGQYLYRRQKYDGWSVRKVRLVAQTIGMGGPSVALLLCAYTTDDKWVSYFFICLATMLIGAIQSGLSCAYLEFSPRFSPIINTIANALGAAAGIVGPILVSALINANPHDERAGWNTAFLISAVMCTLSVVIWVFAAASEPVLQCNTLLPLVHTEAEEEDDPLVDP